VATISDVARKAGVSRTTVSRYLNGQLNDSSDKARRIARAISELRYHPNLLARSLRSATTQSIAVIVPDLSNPFYPTLLSAIEAHLAQHDVQVFVGQSGDDARREPTMLQNYYNRRVDGMIYVSAKSEPDPILRQISESIPVLMLDEQVTGFSDVTVRVDHERGVYQATKYLLDLGHRHITYLAGPRHLTTTLLRLRGFEAALAERSLDGPTEVIYGSYTMDAGRRWVQRFLETPEQGPTAVICANDMVALGVHRTLAEHGVVIPDFLSIIGFDDIFVASLVSPSLTTIRQPFDELGRVVSERLLELLQSGQLRNSPIILPPELIVRESTSPPRTHVKE
jgi:DNA-binding LacI/PurR family transcriptional regulator